MTKYPNIIVQYNDNMFVLASRVRRALEMAGYENDGMKYFDRALDSNSPEELIEKSKEMVTIV